MKICFLDEQTLSLNDVDFSSLHQLGEYTSFPTSTPEQAIKRIKDTDILITNKVLITNDLLKNAHHLKLICITATGYNNVNLKETSKRKITVCNVAGYSTFAVAQHTFSLILNLATKIFQYNTDVKNNIWNKSPLFTLLSYPTFELKGKTIGIIGFGEIGKAIAKIAQAFEMNCLIHSRSPIKTDKYKQVDLNLLCQKSDIISIHCPLTDQTKNLISKKEISLMKKTCLLINTARGGIINEDDLFQALKTKEIAGAGIDVLTEEPPRNGNILLQAKNIIISPHSAWSTVEARQRLIKETALNISAFLMNKPRNVIK